MFGSRPYVQVGDGPTRVVVIAGGDEFMRRFDRRSVERNARRIARVFPEISLSVLGYDASAGTSIEELTATSAELIRAVAGQAVVAGISFGGFIATRVASIHPELVRGLILISSTPKFSREGSSRVAQQIADLERGDILGMARPFVTMFRRRWLNLIGRVTLRWRRRSMEERMNDLQYVVRMLETALACSEKRSPQVAVPTLCVIGERDQFFDITAARALVASNPRARLVIVPRETHTMAIESPRPVRRAIDAFLHDLH